MPLFNPVNLSGGIDTALQSTAQSVPAFPVFILLFIFIMIVMGGASNQRRRTGNSDIPFWMVLGATATTFLALIMSMGGGMINITTLSVTVSVNILCAVWFFLSKVRGEQ